MLTQYRRLVTITAQPEPSSSLFVVGSSFCSSVGSSFTRSLPPNPALQRNGHSLRSCPSAELVRWGS